MRSTRHGRFDRSPRFPGFARHWPAPRRWRRRSFRSRRRGIGSRWCGWHKPARNAASTVSAITVKSAERLAGSAVSYALRRQGRGRSSSSTATKPTTSRKGLASEVEGPPGYPLSGRPPLRREADFILRRNAHHPEGLRHRPPANGGASTSTTRKVRRFFGLSPGALRRVRRIYSRRAPRSSWIAVSHRAPNTPRVPAGGHARVGVGHPEDHAPRPADFGLRLQPRGGRQ